MPGDGADYPLASLKRKLNSWLMGLTKDNTDSFNDSLQSKQITPDTKDIVNLLRSTGFRMVDMKVEKTGSHSSLTSLVCRVTVKCAKSGISVVLESDGECRCPDEAHADNASAWCVLTPTSNQDSLNKSGNVAGSSLLPELPVGVSELVGSATRCVLRLLEDGEGLTPSRGRPSLPSSGGRSRASLQRTSSGVHGDSNRLGAQLSHHRSLDDMQWEASASSGAGTPATPRSTRSVSDASFSPSSALAHARSDGQLAQAGTSTGVPVATTAATPAATPTTNTAADTSLSMDVGASYVAPPRRQSTTLEDYLAFKKPLCNEVEISIESADSVPSTDLPVTRDEVNTPENPAPLPPLQEKTAKEVLKKAQGAIQNMSEVMEMLKKWMISDEVPSTKKSTTQTKLGRVHSQPRSSIPTTRLGVRRGSPAGTSAGDLKKTAGTSRSPSTSSAGSRASSVSSARAGSSVRTLTGPAKTSRPGAASAAESANSAGSSKPARSVIAALARRRSLEDAGTTSSPRTPLARRPRAGASPYVATAPSFGIGVRSPRSTPGHSPALAKRPSPRTRAAPAPPPPPPSKTKRASVE